MGERVGGRAAERFDATTEHFDVAAERFDAAAERFGRPERFDVAAERFDLAATGSDTAAERSDASAEQFDMTAERFDAAAERFDVPAERFDVFAERFGMVAERCEVRFNADCFMLLGVCFITASSHSRVVPCRCPPPFVECALQPPHSAPRVHPATAAAVPGVCPDRLGLIPDRQGPMHNSQTIAHSHSRAHSRWPWPMCSSLGPLAVPRVSIPCDPGPGPANPSPVPPTLGPLLGALGTFFSCLGSIPVPAGLIPESPRFSPIALGRSDSLGRIPDSPVPTFLGAPGPVR